MDKVLKVGKVDCGGSRLADVFVRVTFDGTRLSITGVEGPLLNGNCLGGCGQISLTECVPAPPWTQEMLDKLQAIWNRWHLNDMRAGSTAQESYLLDHPVEAVYPATHYDVASKALADAGLNPDQDGYQYGHGWLTEEVPTDVIEWLESLPESHVTPAWV